MRPPRPERILVDERLIARVQELRKQGLTQALIGVELRVAQGTVSSILRQHGLGGHLVSVKKLRSRP